MAIEIGEGGGALARIPNVRIRKNVIDASSGANYSGGSAFPDSGRLPLMPSTVGLADAELLGLAGVEEEAFKYGTQAASGDVEGAAKGACEAATRAGAAAATTAAGLGPIGGAIPTDLVCGPLVDLFTGAKQKKRRAKKKRGALITAFAAYAKARGGNPIAWYRANKPIKMRLNFDDKGHRTVTISGRKARFVGIMRDMQAGRIPIPKGGRTPYSKYTFPVTWIEATPTGKKEKRWSMLRKMFMANPEFAKRDREAKEQVKAEERRKAEVKAGNRARESARNVGMAIMATAIKAFGEEFRKNPSLIGAGAMAYAVPMRNNPRLAKFDRAQVENLLRSKTNVQAVADTYFKNNPQDKARAFALAVDYKKRQAQLVELNRQIKAKQKKKKAERKQRRKKQRQKQEAKAVEKAASRPGTRGAKKVEKSVGKKAKQLTEKAKRRAKVTLKAGKEAQRLRKKVDRLKKKLAAQKTKTPTQKNVAETNKLIRETQKTADTAEKMEATNAVGTALTKNTAVQAALARQIERAVKIGNMAAARNLTKIYLRLGGVAEKLKDLQKLQLQD